MISPKLLTKMPSQFSTKRLGMTLTDHSIGRDDSNILFDKMLLDCYYISNIVLKRGRLL